MDRYKAYKLEDILRLSVRTYIVLRFEIERLRRIDLADMTRSAAYANAKDVGKIVEQYDPSPKHR